MVSEVRKQLMAWMEMDYSKHMYVFSMEGKMAAGAFGCTRNYGWDGPFNIEIGKSLFKHKVRLVKRSRQYINSCKYFKFFGKDIFFYFKPYMKKG